MSRAKDGQGLKMVTAYCPTVTNEFKILLCNTTKGNYYKISHFYKHSILARLLFVNIVVSVYLVVNDRHLFLRWV